MDVVCKLCRGTPKVFLSKPTCILCKKKWKETHEAEIKQFLYLKEMFDKIKRFSQVSTGNHTLDSVIVFVFGMPHANFGSVTQSNKVPAKVPVYSTDIKQEVIGLETGKLWTEGNKNGKV